MRADPKDKVRQRLAQAQRRIERLARLETALNDAALLSRRKARSITRSPTLKSKKK